MADRNADMCCQLSSAVVGTAAFLITHLVYHHQNAGELAFVQEPPYYDSPIGPQLPPQLNVTQLSVTSFNSVTFTGLPAINLVPITGLESLLLLISAALFSSVATFGITAFLPAARSIFVALEKRHLGAGTTLLLQLFEIAGCCLSPDHTEGILLVSAVIQILLAYKVAPFHLGDAEIVPIGDVEVTCTITNQSEQAGDLPDLTTTTAKEATEEELTASVSPGTYPETSHLGTTETTDLDLTPLPPARVPSHLSEAETEEAPVAAAGSTKKIRKRGSRGTKHKDRHNKWALENPELVLAQSFDGLDSNGVYRLEQQKRMVRESRGH